MRGPLPCAPRLPPKISNRPLSLAVSRTLLGVSANGLEPAIRSCFLSVLDHRVLVYKREKGFDAFDPQMAVLVQEQVSAESAGVGFSLNPNNNDYDEAVIDANWGLGESVVAGLASPDHYVVDKHTGEVLECQLGAKQISIWPGENGSAGAGTTIKQAHRSSERVLCDDQLEQITRVLSEIEQLFAQPVDIEWAWASGRLFLLQTRLITTWVPLPEEMLTEPGERRRLYADAALSKGLTMNEPISNLGLSWLEEMLYSSLLESLIGIDDFTPGGGLVFASGNRFYMNLSNLFRLGMSPRMMSRSTAANDALMAEIMAGIDVQRYRAEKRPEWLRLTALLRIPKLLWTLRRFLWNTFRAFVTPERFRRDCQREVDGLEGPFFEGLDYELPLDEFARTNTNRVWTTMFDIAMPALMAGLVSPDFLIPRRDKQARGLAEKLRRGLPGNVVVEQGMALYRLAQQLGPEEFEEVDELAKRIGDRNMPGAFQRTWDEFVRLYGCRGPMEMDVASPRYGDDPRLALRQMASLNGDGGFDPEEAHLLAVEERQLAYRQLIRRLSWPRRLLLRRLYRLIELFGGIRDTPKYHSVMLTHAIRIRALQEGERLVSEARLDCADQVFDLTFSDLAGAAQNPELDLRHRRDERTQFASRLAGRVAHFPQVIDSRGRILRPPPRPANPDELLGMAVSPGMVSGPVKVLHDPRSGVIEPGDVLVAYTTDPGWTPLFINAAAVVLEVGGTLQHGAVIAREFGKPCVVGIDRVVTRLEDGQQVEVDGSAGAVRIL